MTTVPVHCVALPEDPQFRHLCTVAQQRGSNGWLAALLDPEQSPWVRAVYDPSRDSGPPPDTAGQQRPQRQAHLARQRSDPRPTRDWPPQAADDPDFHLWDLLAKEVASWVENREPDTGYLQATLVLFHQDGWGILADRRRRYPQLWAFCLGDLHSAHHKLAQQARLLAIMGNARSFLPNVLPWWPTSHQLACTWYAAQPF